MTHRKKPPVGKGRIKDNNETIIKNKVESKVRTNPDSEPLVKKMNKNQKDLTKPGTTVKPKEEEYLEDNAEDNKKSASEKENYKEGKFFVQILKKKIKGKIKSIKDHLAADATKERNHTVSKQNLTTIMSTSLPQTIPEVTTDMSSDTTSTDYTGTDYMRDEEQNTGTDYMTGYMGAEELNKGRYDYMETDYKGTDYIGAERAEEQNKGPEYMDMGGYMGSEKMTGKGKIDKMGLADFSLTEQHLTEYQFESSNNEEDDYEDIQESNNGKDRDGGYEYHSEAGGQSADINNNHKHGEFVGIAIGTENEENGNGPISETDSEGSGNISVENYL